MTNEAVMLFELSPPVPMTVSDGEGIEKGTLCSLDDPMTASGAHIQGDVGAGIAATEKIASDGKTKLGIFREGIFKVSLSGSCTAGDVLQLGETANFVEQITTLSGANVFGVALETGADGETIMMELKPFGFGSADASD